MISFKDVFSKKTLLGRLFNPKIRKEIAQDLAEKRKTELSHTRNGIVQLKQLLLNMGYSVSKSEDGSSYHLRKDRAIKLSNPSLSPTKTPIKEKYKMTLFTLAHETGHALQWYTDDGGKTVLIGLEEMLRDYQRIVTDKIGPIDYEKLAEIGFSNYSPDIYNELSELYDFWREIDAWIRGMNYIPQELRKEYKIFAKEKLSTYITPYIKDHLPQFMLEIRMLN